MKENVHTDVVYTGQIKKKRYTGGEELGGRRMQRRSCQRGVWRNGQKGKELFTEYISPEISGGQKRWDLDYKATAVWKAAENKPLFT